MYTVYIKLDNKNNLRAIDSSALLGDVTGWIPIDEGDTSRHMHAQTEYLPGPLIDDERGIKRYRAYQFVDAPAGKIIARFFKDGEEYLILERTQEEMDAEWTEPESKPTIEQRVETLEQKVDVEMADQQEALRILGL